MDKPQPSNTQKRFLPLLIAIIGLALYYAPYLILGQNSYIMIHDNLDGELIQRLALANSGKALAIDDQISQIMHGIPRGCLPSGLNVTVWLFMLFTPFMAYLINDLLVHLIALLGMYLLLKRHVLAKQGLDWVAAGVALAFAVLPFWSILGLVFAGLPLLLYALLNIRLRQSRWSDWLIVVAFPFYSTLIYGSVTILAPLAVVVAVDWIRSKRPPWSLLAALATLTLLYLVVDLPLLYVLLFKSGFKTNRVAFDLGLRAYSLKEIVIESLKRFFAGENKMHSKKLIILGTSAAAAILYGLRRRKGKAREHWPRLLGWLWAGLGSLVLFYTFYNWQVLVPLRESFLPLRVIHFDYIRILTPMLLYLAFALALAMLATSRTGRFVALILIVFQIGCTLNNTDYPEYRLTAVRAMRHMTGHERPNPNAITYREFYSERLFDRVADAVHMSKKSYHIICFGLHPAIAQYNGFYTLDSFQGNYPYLYMQQFRGIISRELEKSKTYRNNFDGWGCYCYLFAADLDQYGMDLPFRISKSMNLTARHVEWNMTRMKYMGATYLISAIPIINEKELGLTRERIFEDPGSPWRIHLYKID
jgi:hypothetical protein